VRQQTNLLDIPIVYEDDWVLAIDKPVGLPSSPTRDPNRDNVLAAARRYLDGYAAIHHRLDLDTTGVMVLAKHKRANKGLARAFRERLARKTYLAVVMCPGDALRAGQGWSMENHLRRDPNLPKSAPARFIAVHAGGDYAKTRFDVVDVGPNRALIACFPETGRTHQIRAHLSECGFPIVGDEQYGGEGDAPMFLHAWKLELPHPVTGEELELEAPVPERYQLR
jgi:23S rRNA pseudouridine1911/1915/1917 synthase